MNGKDNGEFPATPVLDGLPGENGLTKRELFAAMAMQGLLSTARADLVIGAQTDALACRAAHAADALLQELAK